MADSERKSTEQLKADLAAARFDDERLDVLVQLRERGADMTPEEFDDLMRQGVELARTCGRHEDRGKLATTLANVCMNNADPDGMVRWAEVVREVAAATGGRRLEGSYSYLVGHAHQQRAEYDRAHECFENAQRVWTEVKYVNGMSAALSALAGLHGFRGRYARGARVLSGVPEDGRGTGRRVGQCDSPVQCRVLPAAAGPLGGRGRVLLPNH